MSRKLDIFKDFLYLGFGKDMNQFLSFILTLKFFGLVLCASALISCFTIFYRYAKAFKTNIFEKFEKISLRTLISAWSVLTLFLFILLTIENIVILIFLCFLQWAFDFSYTTINPVILFLAGYICVAFVLETKDFLKITKGVKQ